MLRHGNAFTRLRRHGRATLLACIALLGTTGALCRNAEAAAIWFGGDDPFVAAAKGRRPNDYMTLFTGNGAWAKGVDVVLVSSQFVNKGREQDLAAVIGFVNAHHIGLAMAGLMLVSDGTCGIRVEGYSGPQDIEIGAQRIRRLGGQISYLAMDEPLYYGSVYDGPRACHTPVQALAAAVASRVAHLKAIFPNVRIVDDEPIGAPPEMQLPRALAAWFDAYRAATGRSLDAFHADISWPKQNWPAQLRFAQRLANRSGTRLGIYFDGDGNAPDGNAWTGQALQRAGEIQQSMGIVPDDAVIFSWMNYPDRMLPPDDPSTLTGLVRGYMHLGR